MTSHRRGLLTYCVLLGGAGALLFLILRSGEGVYAVSEAARTAQAAASGAVRVPLGLQLAQLVVIVTACRLAGAAARALGQPAVVGEMAAGIALGPSLLGAVWPATQTALFPPGSLEGLRFLSHIGLILFMFMVGLDVNAEILGERAEEAVAISHASIVAPFVLGALVSLGLYSSFAPAGVPFTEFALFMGTAMSVTAFPVLARILQEKGLTRAPLGSLALSCAAVDDATAWCALTAVLGVARGGSALGALGVAAQAAAFTAVMALAVRPALRWWLRRSESGEGTGETVLGLLVAFGAAWTTEAIGIHALFGAFIAGVLMPRDSALTRALPGHLERFTVLVLLPVFFALTGLRTQIPSLGGAEAWGACGLVVLAAVAGKLGGSALAARWVGLGWRDSLALGTLMNARGLIELVILNIGYDIGVLTPGAFTAMVVMALVTTLMTGPMLDLVLKGSDPAALRRAPAA